ncbi:peptide chain release factor N(5)-glutamine methyltransferase [Pelagibacteraceae bacterium]|nr:peptide chain release factor N(5)-glutamine methyltransferase [Pelagibacteraceae bacterium]MDC3156333.1 peptide chain release factor N(5)-glutamine methyltransferase [Pelagibacteraceae bacterium]
MNNLIKESLLKLKQININNPELDLRILLKYASKKNNEIILSNLDVDNIDIVKFKTSLQKRINRQPIAKIIKSKSFWKYDFYVNNNVLDPRPETELIIEQVLNIYKNKNLKLKILDIGTGSGCIAISLAKEFKNASITAIDISQKALGVAAKNLKIHNCGNQIQLKLIDFKSINSKFDLIVSNPPYLTNDQFYNTDPEVKNFEPKLALFGGDDGLKFYREFSSSLQNLMNKKAYFVCEIGFNQRQDCEEIFQKSGLNLINIEHDLQGIERILCFLNI